MVLGGEPARRRLGRATAAQRLGFRQYSREDSERAQQARFESSRDHRTRTNRSPVIGLSSTACRTLPEEQLLRPIAGERSLLVRWSREDSKRACRARSESPREYCRKPNRWAAVCGAAQAPMRSRGLLGVPAACSRVSAS